MHRFLRRVFRGELVWLMAAQGISFIGGFAVVKMLAIALGTEGYGYYSLCLSLSAIVSLLWYGPLDQIILRYWNGTQDDRFLLQRMTISGHLLGGAVLIFGSLTLFLASNFSQHEKMINMIILALLLAIPKGLFSSFFSVQNAIRNRRALFALQLLEIISRFSVIVLFHQTLTAGKVILITMFSAALPVMVIALLRGNFSNLKNKFIEFKFGKSPLPDLHQSKKFLNYGRSFLLIGIFAAACNYADRWIIQFNMSLSDVGIYSAIAQIATVPLIALTTVTTQFLNPIIFNMDPKQKINWKHIYTAMASVYGLVTLIFYIFSKNIINLLLSPEFLPYHQILPGLAFGLSFFYAAQIYFIKAQKIEKPHIIQPVWIVRSLTMLVLSITLINALGVWGVVVSIIVSSVIFLGMLVIQFNRVEKEILGEIH